MSGRVQNQVCKGTLEDKRENVHFVIDRDNTVNTHTHTHTQKWFHEKAQHI